LFGRYAASPSSCFSRRISEGITPPYFLRQLPNVASEIPALRRTSPIVVPSSAWRSTNDLRIRELRLLHRRPSIIWPNLKLEFSSSGRSRKQEAVTWALRPEQIRAAAEDSGFLMPSAAALEHRYSALRLPMAIVAGAEDRIVDVERQSARLHHDVPGSELWVVPGQGHMVHHAAGVVADAVETVAARSSTLSPR
jgi:pimeloyl-ACP methyl ester carboxylesterase